MKTTRENKTKLKRCR